MQKLFLIVSLALFFGASTANASGGHSKAHTTHHKGKAAVTCGSAKCMKSGKCTDPSCMKNGKCTMGMKMTCASAKCMKHGKCTDASCMKHGKCTMGMSMSKHVYSKHHASKSMKS